MVLQLGSWYTEEFAFDDYDDDEEEGEVEAGITEAVKGPGIVCWQWLYCNE